MELQFLTIKDIMNLCNCSKHKAMKVRSDISHLYGIRKDLITMWHLKDYLGIN